MNPKRKRLGPVTIECRMCSWTGQASTWRPARRLRDEHMAKKHKKAARAEA